MLPVFTILGARGSRPVCGADAGVHGGNTTCFLLQTAAGALLIDAGTGLNRVAASLAADSDRKPVTFLFTHFHLDHLAGLPSAHFLYQRGRRVRFFADAARSPGVRTTLETLLTPPFWPVPLERAGAAIEYGGLSPGTAPVEINGVEVRALPLCHPQGSLGFCLEWSGCRLVVATDHEPGDEATDAALIDFARNADYLLLDAQYVPEQRAKRRGWGHGDWQSAAAIAAAAHAGCLVLVHHDPGRNDDALNEIAALAGRSFPPTVMAREGMRLPVKNTGVRKQ